MRKQRVFRCRLIFYVIKNTNALIVITNHFFFYGCDALLGLNPVCHMRREPCVRSWYTAHICLEEQLNSQKMSLLPDWYFWDSYLNPYCEFEK